MKPVMLRRSHLVTAVKSGAIVVIPPPTGDFILKDNQLDKLLLDDNTSRMLRDG